ncbi:hypothetical protein MA16_Dca016481 [Dendrobium catenatum]|uniref:Uncharacterized protein n=1 Tax=Dendrobium catenatum TaxID=906689 RepID=A0A2I0VYT7_9ASPA|nr:hypothetical protein MA16_Dca016481 [Dendrobium catenatum]
MMVRGIVVGGRWMWEGSELGNGGLRYRSWRAKEKEWGWILLNCVVKLKAVKLVPCVDDASLAAPLGDDVQFDSVLPLGAPVDVEAEATDLFFTIVGWWYFQTFNFGWWWGGAVVVFTSPIVVGNELDSRGFVELSLNSCELFLSNVPFVDVSVALISHDALKAHLAVNLEGSDVDHNDWLDGYISSPCVGDRDDLDGLEEDDHEVYNLKVSRIVEKAFSLGGGKHRRRKHKKR